MHVTKAQIIEVDGKPAFAVVPYDDWLKIQKLMEDVADQAAVVAFAESQDEPLPAEITEALLAGENPARVFRHHRKMTLRNVSDAVGVTVPYLSQIETGKRRPSLLVARRLARALHVPVDMLVGRRTRYSFNRGVSSPPSTGMAAPEM
jgi:DNA-binding XRE family transcriptional regulator